MARRQWAPSSSLQPCSGTKGTTPARPPRYPTPPSPSTSSMVSCRRPARSCTRPLEGNYKWYINFPRFSFSQPQCFTTKSEASKWFTSRLSASISGQQASADVQFSNSVDSERLVEAAPTLEGIISCLCLMMFLSAETQPILLISRFNLHVFNAFTPFSIVLFGSG